MWLSGLLTARSSRTRRVGKREGAGGGERNRQTDTDRERHRETGTEIETERDRDIQLSTKVKVAFVKMLKLFISGILGSLLKRFIQAFLVHVLSVRPTILIPSNVTFALE